MLTIVQINALKPREKAYKVADGRGQYLAVQPSGSLIWRVKFRYHGVEKKITLGHYPAVGLKEAREKLEEARELLSGGIDPVAVKAQAKLQAEIAAATTFTVVADEYIRKMELEGKSPATLKKARWFRDLLERYVGRRPVAAVTAHELLAALKRLERKGHHETAHRLRAFSGRIFRYAVSTLRAQHNPADILRGALIAPKVKHHAAVLDPVKVGELLRAIDSYSGRVETRIALQLAPHVFLRPGELRKAEWSEIDFGAAVWRIPATKMKMGQAHVVPLSRQVMGLLQKLRALENSGESFPHSTRRCGQCVRIRSMSPCGDWAMVAMK